MGTKAQGPPWKDRGRYLKSGLCTLSHRPLRAAFQWTACSSPCSEERTAQLEVRQDLSASREISHRPLRAAFQWTACSSPCSEERTAQLEVRLDLSASRTDGPAPSKTRPFRE